MATWKEFLRSWVKTTPHRERTKLRCESLESRDTPSISVATTPTPWTAVGPVGINNMSGVETGPPAQDIGSGAIEGVAVDPFNPNHVIIGAVNGGIWSTTNYTAASPVWTTNTDNMPSLAISAVAFSPTLQNVVYAGTGSFSAGGLGDNFSADVTNPGEGGPPVGLYKSTDGGATWTQSGASVFTGMRIRSVVPTSLNGGQTIFVATADSNGPNTGGVYESDNGGVSWRRISGSNGLPSLGDTSLVPDLGNPDRFYSFAFDPTGTGTGAGVYMLNVEGGNTTWKNISNNLPASVATGDRVLLATSPAGADPVYAAVIDASGIPTGVYRAVAFGSTYVWTAIGPGGLPPDVSTGAQATTHFAIVADPTSDRIVYVAGDRVNGNTLVSDSIARGDAIADTWTTITLPDPSPGPTTPGTTPPLVQAPQPTTAPHADSRWMVFANNNTILLGTDGGIYEVTNPRAENNQPPVWSSLDGNMQISEIYMSDVDDQNTVDTSDDIYLAAAQDNGESEGTAGTQFGQVFGGDGVVARADSADGFQYFSAQEFNPLVRINPDGSISFPTTQIVGTAFGVSGNVFFRPPIALGQANKNLMLIGGDLGDIYLSSDQGDTFTSIGGIPVPAAAAGLTATPVTAVSFSAEQEPYAAYVATDDGNIGMSFDMTVGSGNFTETNFKTVAKGVPAFGLWMDPNNPLVAYAVTNQGVYRTTDGMTWQDISGNLPGLVAKGGETKLYSIQVLDQGTFNNPSDTADDTILVGGFGGVYIANAPLTGNVVWSKLSTGIPNVIVSDLIYDPLSDTLVAGTYGRGIWKLKLNETVEVVGSAANNVMSIAPDPSIPGNFIVADGLGNTEEFSSQYYRRVQFQGLAGADTISVGSTNPNVAGTTTALPVEIDANGGGNPGDSLIFQDAADTAAEQGTLTASSFGAGTGDTIFGNGFATFTGFNSGTVAVQMGTSSADKLIYDDSATSAAASYTVTSNSITRSLGGSYTYSGAESLGLVGGPGNDAFAIQSVPGAISIDGGAGSDTATMAGTPFSDAITAIIDSATDADLTGFTDPVHVANLENFAFDGEAGFNSFTLQNLSGIAFGTPTDPGDGIVYGPTGPNSGFLRAGSNGFSFSNINGGVTVSGAGPGSGDTLLVLGTSAPGLQSPYGEAVIGDGRDIINATDSSVTVQTITGTQLLGVSMDPTTFSTIYIASGNEAGPQGDQITVTPSATVNLIVDGMGPVGVPGDQVTVLGPGPFTKESDTDPNDGPPQTRFFSSDGSAVGVLGSEDTGLPSANVSSGMIAVASDSGPVTTIQVYDRLTNALRYQITPFDDFTDGVTVASGDVNGDGIADLIVGAGPGGGPRVAVYDGFDGSLIENFFAYEPTFMGGVNVSTADFNHDGFSDIVVGTGVGGGPRVRVFSGQDLSVIRDAFVYPSDFRGGVNVTTGDFNGDGTPDLITSAGAGGGPEIAVLSGIDLTPIANFFAFDPNSRNGFYVASGDVNGDGFADVIVGNGAGGPAEVRVISGLTHQAISDFFVNDPLVPGNAVPAIQFDAGVRVAAADVNGDGIDDIITAKGPGSTPTVRIYQVGTVDPTTHTLSPTLQEIKEFDAFDGGFAYGMFVGASD